jgi:cystathionine gamma-synthase/methionine-gamma-lyase
VRALHPSLSTGQAAEIVARQMAGTGGMVSFIADADATGTAAIVDRLRLFAIAPSLGGVESLVTQPVTTTHHGLTEDERARRGIVGGLVRLSIGLEEPEDLIDDLDHALATP